MIRQTREIKNIPGVGGPFIETSVGDPSPGGCLYIGLERGPDYRDEPSHLPGAVLIGTSFALGLLTGVLLPVMVWL